MSMQQIKSKKFLIILGIMLIVYSSFASATSADVARVLFGGLATNYSYNPWGNCPVVNGTNWCTAQKIGYVGGHSGIDIQTQTRGTEDFFSVSNGIVIGVGGSYGIIAVYDNVRNITVIYIHSSYSYVKKDDPVRVGTRLGKQGDTGSPGAYHVHLEARTGYQTSGAGGKQGTIDPVATAMAYLNSVYLELDATPSQIAISPDPIISGSNTGITAKISNAGGTKDFSGTVFAAFCKTTDSNCSKAQLDLEKTVTIPAKNRLDVKFGGTVNLSPGTYNLWFKYKNGESYPVLPVSLNTVKNPIPVTIVAASTTKKLPILNSPTDGSTVSYSPSVNFSWNNNNNSSTISEVGFALVEVDSSGKTIAVVGTCSAKSLSAATTSYSSSNCGANLKASTRYKWAIALIFNDGSLHTSATAFFTTKAAQTSPTPKNLPILNSPTDGSTVSYSPSVNFSWNNNNSSGTISKISFGLREVDSSGNTIAVVGTCSTQTLSTTTTTSYSSSNCGADLIKASTRYKWAIVLTFNDGSLHTSATAFFTTKAAQTSEQVGSGTCSTSNWSACTTEQTCKDAGGAWWSISPAKCVSPPTISFSHPVNGQLQLSSDNGVEASERVYFTLNDDGMGNGYSLITSITGVNSSLFSANSLSCSGRTGGQRYVNCGLDIKFSPAQQIGSFSASVLFKYNGNPAAYGTNASSTLNVTGIAATSKINLTVNTTGSGTVTGTGISCGSDCTESYNANTQVVLTASPASGYTFASWTGCNSASGTTCNVTMSSAKTVTANFTQIVTSNTARLINISTRAQAKGGADDVYAAFVVQGSGTKTVMVRGLGVNGTDTTLTVLNITNSANHINLGSNDNWQSGNPRLSEIYNLAANLQPQLSTDSGLLLDLTAGVYTVIVSSTSNNGQVVAGVDDVGGTGTATLVNISTRAQALGGADDIYAAFVVQGSGTLPVMIRGLGVNGTDTTLTVLNITNANHINLGNNDDWENSPRASEIRSLPVNLQPQARLDSGLLLELPAGVYTAIIGSFRNAGQAVAGVDALR